MDAAYGAEAVRDPVLVELVFARVRLRRLQRERFARHEPQERSLALADRAVARQRALDVALDVERDAAAVTASGVLHDVASRQPCGFTTRLVEAGSTSQHSQFGRS